MRFFADLHVHSRFSRATSKYLTIQALGDGAFRKGIKVLGTGDFTHPGWLAELEENLAPAEPGLFRLKDRQSRERFILTSEISTIYKSDKADKKVRKVHHLIVAPDLKAVRRINTELAKIGNILSDGRPILGISSRNLLEIVLNADENAYLIPAHIWTPWFSAMGSKSGFDSIAECYLDLEPYIFAVETGLSSDPAMNWEVTTLDRYHLVSNSDAHSAEKLGREATIFDTAVDYFAIRDALKDGQGLVGTVEFFPEEGKYHLDGHRECGVVLSPEQTRELGGKCPVCGRMVTVGVLNRVEELSDRHDGTKPDTARPFYSLIPLAEIIGEIMQVGSSSKRVRAGYERVLKELGGELPILLDADIADITRAGGDMLGLGISRMRSQEVHKEPGYDGKYGIVKVFKDNEKDLLFADAFSSGAKRRKPRQKVKRDKAKKQEKENPDKTDSIKLNPAQAEAADFRQGTLVVKAGPGTGKTRVLVERMKSLVTDGHKSILAVTFTTKAAQEIADRLNNEDVQVFTFHGLAAWIMRQAGIDFHIADEALIRETASSWNSDDTSGYTDDLIYRQSTLENLEQDQAFIIDVLKKEGYYTYEGLIEEARRILNDPGSCHCWDHVLVDEFQDINPLQYTFLQTAGRGAKSIMIIGDPNQAIYSFRGSNPQAFEDFVKDYPATVTIDLKDTHRLNRRIASVSNRFIGEDVVVSSKDGLPVRLIKTVNGPDFIAKEIESLAGGLSHSTIGKAKGEYGLSDIAVVVRTRSQTSSVIDALDRASIPHDTAYARPLAEVSGVSQRLNILSKVGWLELIKGIGDKSLKNIDQHIDPGPAVKQRIMQAQSFVDSLEGSIGTQIEAMESSGLFKLPKLDRDHVLYKYAGLFGDDVDGFITYCKLSHDQGALREEKVRVLTAHAAKGLEFKCVFISGLAQGVFPLAGMPDWEEQNLFYVAMTRAVDLLYLVCPRDTQSRFIKQIDSDHCIAYEEKILKNPGQMFLFEQ